MVSALKDLGIPDETILRKYKKNVSILEKMQSGLLSKRIRLGNRWGIPAIECVGISPFFNDHFIFNYKKYSNIHLKKKKKKAFNKEKAFNNDDYFKFCHLQYYFY